MSRAFRNMFSDFRRMLDEFETTFGDVEAITADLEREASSVEAAKAGETVTTRREETRPDGTRVITTITTSRR